jgi:vanillate O-demethylase monooxygenase subunit
MGALDDTHFPWVHPDLLGDRARPEAPDHRVARYPDRVVSEYLVRQPRPHAAADLSAGPGEASELADAGEGTDDLVSYTNTVTVNTIHLVKRSAEGTYVIWLAGCPVDSDQTTTFWRIGRDFDLDPAHDEAYERFEDLVREQDRPIVESQRPWLLPPLASRLSLYVRPADAPLIAYQEWLEERGIPQI